jgi:autotransporter-associated beta strand protein
MSALISDAGADATSLTKSSTGRWVLPGANTYSGMTTVSGGGTLAIGNDQSLGTGPLTFNGGSIASSQGPRTIANPVVLALNGGVGGAADFTFTGSLTTSSATGSLTVNNSGTTTLAGPINISNDATNHTLTISGSGNTLGTGVIANGGTSTAGRLTKNGPGTLTLTGNNTYAGKTTIAGGTLVASSLNSVSGGSATSNLGAPTTVADGTIGLGSPLLTGTLRYVGPGETTDRVIDLATPTGGGAIDSSGTGPLTFTSDFTATGADSKTLTLQGNSAGENLIAGAIVDHSASHKTSLVKSGAGKWVLSGVNTYSGGTTVSAGELVVSGDSARLGTGNVTVQGGGSALLIQPGAVDAISNSATLNLFGGGEPSLADQGYLELGAGLNELVGALLLGGVAQSHGLSYGSTTSGAMIQLDEYFAGSGMIAVGMLGDFNGDNAVDAADYVLWRKSPGAFGGSNGHEFWRIHFGSTSSIGGNGHSQTHNSAPEPTSIFLLLLGFGGNAVGSGFRNAKFNRR